jgi:large repetitive protein
MTPDGTAAPTNWLSGDDGFLALDVNNNGKIDNITELFSEYFAEGIDTGLGALSTLDENSDGIIDQNDSQFANLQIWQDTNQDGISGADELRSLADHGIESFDLNVTQANELLLDSTMLSSGSVGTSDGTTKGPMKVKINHLATLLIQPI